MTTIPETSPFFEPLEYGYQLVSEVQCVCDYDFYHTGDPGRANGCGGTYYRRISIAPNGLVINERKPCQCMLEYEEQNKDEQEKQHRQNESKAMRLEIDRLFRHWNMLFDESFSHMRLETFNPAEPGGKPTLAKISGFQWDHSICFFGMGGRGKTHLAVGLGRKAYSMGMSVLAIRSIDLLNRLKKCYDAKDESLEIDVMGVLKKVDLLIVDDIGQEKPTRWVREKLYDIIDYRNNRKPTIYTTNESHQTMRETLGEGIMSRVFGAGEQIKVEGKDHRVAYDEWSNLGREVEVHRG